MQLKGESQKHHTKWKKRNSKAACYDSFYTPLRRIAQPEDREPGDPSRAVVEEWGRTDYKSA